MRVRGSWRLNKDCNILTPTLMAIGVVSFSFSRAAQPEAWGPSSLLDDGFLYCILSPTGLQNSIEGPVGPFGWVWLSLPHLVSNSSDLQLVSGAPKAPSARRWLSPLHLISNFSGPQLTGGPEGPFRLVWLPYHILSPTPLLPVFTELYNSSIVHSIAHSIFGMACLIVIKRK